MNDEPTVSYWDPLEEIWNDQPHSEEPDEFLKWFRRLTKVQQILFPTHWLCAEVYNGGFHQYFSNPTGLHAPEAVLGFRKLGLDDIATLVEKTVSVFGATYPREHDVRENFLESIPSSERIEWNPFADMDEEFYEIIKIPGKPDFYDDDRFTIAAKDLVEKSS
ncbi:MAG TPA: DUF4375 domain-containing protein [Pyrinomonadaceae bacterium]|nr:DUF4375 domain-containing protein [Pyrinomonadaceae bacterium]